jgi:hypothetical protein
VGGVGFDLCLLGVDVDFVVVFVGGGGGCRCC